MPIKVSKVACQSCGSTLKVNESTRYVTCNYCDAQLEIVHDETVTHSKVLEQILEKQKELSDEVRILRLERELRRLEDQWNVFRESVSSRSKDGRIVEPTHAGGYASMIFGVLLCVVLVFLGFSLHGEGGNGLVFFVMGVIICVSFIIKGNKALHYAAEYSRMKIQYINKRSAIHSEMHALARDMEPMRRSGKAS